MERVGQAVLGRSFSRVTPSLAQSEFMNDSHLRRGMVNGGRTVSESRAREAFKAVGRQDKKQGVRRCRGEARRWRGIRRRTSAWRVEQVGTTQEVRNLRSLGTTHLAHQEGQPDSNTHLSE